MIIWTCRRVDFDEEEEEAHGYEKMLRDLRSHHHDTYHFCLFSFRLGFHLCLKQFRKI